MTRRRGLLLVALAGLAGALLGAPVLGAPVLGPAARAQAAPARAAAPVAATSPARATAPARPVLAGVAVPEVPPADLPAELDRLKADGINTVSMFVWWLTSRRDSTALAPYPGTQSDSALLSEMRTAVHKGLAVTLTPIFYCQGCEGGWRGTAEPSDVDAFFASYRRFMDHYADLAAQGGASTLYVGSEMTSLEDRTAQWERVAAEARRHFPGKLGYEENWDVLGRARFLPAVDVIGVSAYFPLDDSPAPTLARLRADWTASRSGAAYGRNWVGALDHLARSTGRPIVFGEVGYMSGDYAARQPFLNFQGQADWQLQSDLYQALLETFSPRPWWGGVVWWDWFRAPAGPNDNTRTPRAKTAEALLRAWYHDGRRPTDPDRPLVLSPALAKAAAARTVATVNAARHTEAASRSTSEAALAMGAGAGAGVPARGLGAGHTVVLALLVILLGGLAAAVWMTLGRPVRPAGASGASGAAGAAGAAGAGGVPQG